MAWQDISVKMLRILIDDMSGTLKYQDIRLEQLLMLAATYIIQEIQFDYTYTIDLMTNTITPDPSGINDNVFINFLVLKAACILDLGQLRNKALVAGVIAKAGPTSIDTSKYLDGFKELLSNGPCAAYEQLKKEWMFGNSGLCRAILTPFTGNDFDPQSLA